MTRLDGNAAAGDLFTVFGRDLTTASARCVGCGAVEQLARTAVFVTAMGTVVRCEHCEAVLAVIVSSRPDATTFSMSGISALTVSAT